MRQFGYINIRIICRGLGEILPCCDVARSGSEEFIGTFILVLAFGAWAASFASFENCPNSHDGKSHAQKAWIILFEYFNMPTS